MTTNQFIKYHNQLETHQIASDELQVRILDSGDIVSIKDENIFINQLQANHLDGMVMNLYLRKYVDGAMTVYPLLGKMSNSTFSFGTSSLHYQGMIENDSYEVVISLVKQSMFFDIKVNGQFEYDIIYAQDVAISAGVMNNEAYCSQYIDIKACKQETGYALAFRQNQSTYKGHAYLELGSLNTQVVSYATDGFDFYGLSYKQTNVIEGIHMPQQSNRVYQYEFTMGVLQSAKLNVNGKAEHNFYLHYQPSHPLAIQELAGSQQVVSDYSNRVVETALTKTTYNPIRFNYLSGLSISKEDVLNQYETTRHHEYDDTQLLSFFANENKHVVLMEKELQCERAHGHILLAKLNNHTFSEKLSATNYIYGVFPTQIVCGNTNLNKFNSNVRNGLNVQKLNGQRIWIKQGTEYTLLGMPSYFEMDLNTVKWVYLLEDDQIVVEAVISSDKNILSMQITSIKTHEFIISNHLVVGAEEFANDYDLSIQGTTCIVKPDANTFIASKYPNIDFTMNFDQEVSYQMDSIFNYKQSMLCCHVTTNNVKFTISGNVEGGSDSITGFLDAMTESNKYRTFFSDTLQGFKLSHDSQDVLRMNDLVYWYTHNMLIHYQSPHGLEQYGGAAWGSRDVSQGPFEYYLAFQNFDVVKTILIEIFSHQLEEDGSWPQWFMFDRYLDIFADESHGDIIVWPLYAMAQYLERTSDFAILDELVPYVSKTTRQYTEKVSMLNHLLKEINYIKSHYLNDTHLSCYGDGDWDDTLQPANPLLRKTMVSGWTTTLTYDAFTKLGNILQDFDKVLADELLDQAQAIKTDYMKYVVKDGVVAGFLHFEEDKINYLIHPSDKTTGLNYRLLPMTRSIIGGMFDLDMALSHKAIIDQNLYHPDGVRLMNTTCKYQGGVNTYFMRAETASNFGREIGLQYVHAHIRYIEAMAKLGDTKETWTGLMKINPIQIKETVPNACMRQANSYFSSSDGQFANRYEAMENFDKLRTGEVDVKGGWRIYSSGPGIYLNQLVSSVLGIRVNATSLILDPVLPVSLDGMKLEYMIDSKPVVINYHFDNENPRVELDGKVYTERMANPYRTGAYVIDKSVIKENQIINIYL